MALLGRDDLKTALEKLGELAAADSLSIELLIVGGGVMVIEFDERLSTRDLDGIVVNDIDRAKVRGYAATIADEQGWQHDWLNDAAKRFMTGFSDPVLLYSAPGIRVHRPSLEQLLAMKLCAWRDDTDISDAARLLRELIGTRDEIWNKIQLYLQVGQSLKARYAFDDLWESRA
jgi:hypothetical protein